MTKYLSGSKHYLSKEEAERYNNSSNELRLEDDGTWSVYHLVNRPVQHGQMPWKKS